MTVEKLDALKGGDSWDFRWNKEPKCPHCGHEASVSHNDLWSIYEEGEHAIDCPLCEHQFTVSTTVEYRFSTDEQEPSHDQ